MTHLEIVCLHFPIISISVAVVVCLRLHRHHRLAVIVLVATYHDDQNDKANDKDKRSMATAAEMEAMMAAAQNFTMTATKQR